jgi:signal peptidase II
MNVLALTAVLVLALDQVTKWLVLHHIHPHHEVPVIAGFFNLTHVLNRGAAWGMFAHFPHSNVVLATFSILTILALWLMRHSLAAVNILHRIAFGMIAGGIFGNLTDRVVRGSVVDFLDFYLGDALGHWPAFNIADSAICVGVGFYLLITFWPDKPNTAVPELPSHRKFGEPPPK